DLFVTDLEGAVRRLTNDRYADLLPAWSPDGQTIAFSTDRGDATDFQRLTYGNYRVALYHLERNAIEVLPQQDAGRNLNPVWAPDGRSLVWVSDRTGIHNLYLFDLEARELSRVSDVLSGVIAITPLSPGLSWSKSDGRLLFVYFEQAGYNVYAAADPRKLPRVPVSQLPPAPPAVQIAVAEAEKPPQVDTVSLGAAAAEDAAVVASYYREGNAFRPSGRAAAGTGPASAPQGGPVSVMALLDSAELALPDTSAFQVQDYSVKFSPDIVGRPTIGASVGGFYGNGVYGGSYVALSDMLGNHNILLAGNVNGSFSDATFFAGYNFLKTRANYGVAVEQIPFYRYLGGGPFTVNLDGQPNNVVAHVLLRDIIRTAQGVVSYPFSTYRRLELGASVTRLERDILYRGGWNFTRQEPFQRDVPAGDALNFIEPVAALVFDNSLFGWTGPIYGRRYRLQASRTFGDFEYTEGLVDFRNYLNYKRWVVFAARLVTLTRLGRDANRFSLFWGGPYFLRGYDGDSFELNGEECRTSREFGTEASISPCPVRDQLIGSSAALLNLELRFPIITELQIGFLGNFPPVDAVLFFDGGMAWDQEVCTVRDLSQPNECAQGTTRDVRLVWDRKPGDDPYLVREPLFSYGLGLRFNIFYTVLRLDYALPLNRPDRSGRFTVSFGPSF
ncbi:MAG: PD40 domain-containing protein, partial [Gemmatimonadetes bacterium]|nr:PD40 domain-containing protein [Gemmatimonadota bacterium]